MAVEVERLSVVLEARLDQYNRALIKGQADTNKRLGAIERRFQQTTARVRQSAVSMGAIAGTIGAYLSIDQLIGYANAWTRVERSIEAGGDVFGITLKSAGELTRLANDARIDVEAYAKTYIRTAAAIRDYGYDSETAAEVTSTLAKALKLGSASASEQASTILQFSQALQKGKLDGDEFRTVMENAGVIQELLAKRLRVTKGEIVKMAAAGKLQLLDLVGAMTEGAEQINNIFNLMPTTVDEAFTVLNNSITQFVGKMDDAYGISTTLTGALKFLSENIDTVGKAALVAGVGLLAMFAPAIIAGVAALGVGIVAAGGAIGGLTGILGAATAAFSLFGDDISVTSDGVVSLKDTVAALALELKTTMGVFDEFEARFAYAGEAFRGQFLAPLADRVRETARLLGETRKWSEGTTVSKARPTHPNVTGMDADKGADRARRRFEKDLLNIENRIDAEQVEADVIGRSAFEAEKLRVQTHLLNEARKAGIDLTADDKLKIEALSTAMAQAVTETDALRDAYSQMQEESKDVLKGFITDMKDGKSATEALADSLNKIADKLIDMAVNNLVEMALGGLTGKGGNPASTGGSILKLFGFADGGYVRGPGSGRSDSIPARLSNGEYVVNSDATKKHRAMLDAINSGKVAGFADGGIVSAAPMAQVTLPNAVSGGGSGAPVVNSSITLNVANGTPEGVSKMQNETLPQIQKIVRSEVKQIFDRSPRFRRSGI